MQEGKPRVAAGTQEVSRAAGLPALLTMSVNEHQGPVFWDQLHSGHFCSGNTGWCDSKFQMAYTIPGTRVEPQALCSIQWGRGFLSTKEICYASYPSGEQRLL